MKKLPGGYHGKLLRIDLSKKTIKIENIDPKILMNFIGGRGLGVKYLYDELEAGTVSLSAENKLLFVTAPSHGSKIPTSSRYTVVTKSPLTNSITFASSGGHFGVDLKNTGFDMLILEGKSAKPVFISIIDDKVEILDATELWGKKVEETTDTLRSKYSQKIGVACIGPAGEKLSLISAIINDSEHAAARAGVGAVMGSKNLKAIVAFGTTEIIYPNSESLQFQKKEWLRYIGEAPLTKNSLKEYGTPVLVEAINKRGALATRNFQESVFEDTASISAETLKRSYYQRTAPCKYCTVGCSHITAVDGRTGKGPEFETIWSFGPMCGINDLRMILHANYNCNSNGIDTISAGSTIACAMELSEKGLLTDDFDNKLQKILGRKLEFGDAEAVVKISELMGTDDEVGKLFAKGSVKFAEFFNSGQLAMHAKKLELPAYDPRGYTGMALSLATNNRGGCHQKAYLIATESINAPFEIDRFSESGKAGIVKLYQDTTAVIDSMGVCLFTNFALNPDHYAKMLSALTDLDINIGKTLEIGERIWNIEKLFNIREGFSRKDDDLPQRLKSEPLKKGHSKNHVVDLENLLDEYYKLRGWDKEGVPTKETLGKLGL